jgi:hypothetical protein
MIVEYDLPKSFKQEYQEYFADETEKQFFEKLYSEQLIDDFTYGSLYIIGPQLNQMKDLIDQIYSGTKDLGWGDWPYGPLQACKLDKKNNIFTIFYTFTIPEDKDEILAINSYIKYINCQKVEYYIETDFRSITKKLFQQ